MSAERDPRVDPRPGDLLIKGANSRRGVAFFDAEHNLVEYQTPRAQFRRSLNSWRSWARNATIITRGPDADR